MTSNLVALIRWPFAALLGADAPAAGTPHTPHEATQPHPSPGKPVAVDAEALNDLIGSGQPVLVDFWAAWCGPCIAMNPSLHRVADDMGRACVVAKVDTMKHQPVAEAHGVKGLPTLVLFVDGEEAERHAGALSYVGLRSLLERHLPEHAFPA